MKSLFKSIDDADMREIYYTTEYLTFLVEPDKGTHDMVVKTTSDLLKNAGYNYAFDKVEKEYYNCY